MRMITRLLFLLIGCLVGCAFDQRQPIPYEPERIKVQTRDYPGITPEQVLTASEEIFQLADGGKMQIKRGSSVLEATRPLHSLVFKSFWERWKVEAQETEGSAYVTVSAELIKDGSKVSPRGNGAYHLFFARLDYMLGASEDWMTCDQYEGRLIRDSTWGHDDRFLCVNAKDRTPETNPHARR